MHEPEANMTLLGRRGDETARQGSQPGHRGRTLAHGEVFGGGDFFGGLELEVSSAVRGRSNQKTITNM
jgi:hypothetical protein